MPKSSEYRSHHYVPQWYQEKFMLPGEHQLFYLDLNPDHFTDPRGVVHVDKHLRQWGSKKCFEEKDLYTAKIRGIESRDIEKYFFGKIDTRGRPAVDYFENFSYPLKHWKNYLKEILIYMSAQKLRTPKGLSFLAGVTGAPNKDNVLRELVRLLRIHCAIWTECVWLIADASRSGTKFIVSDHPVTVYNRECGPKSESCRGPNDPDIWLEGTHTIFPLSFEKVLILTNLSWVRDPYQSARNLRPNPKPFRNAIFKFTDIQVLRHLEENEVRQINFIIKNRAFRYIAAAKEEWLYPERYVSKSDWNRFGHGYLLMPDPRAIHWGGTVMWGNEDGTGGAMDEYGRLPGDPNFEREEGVWAKRDSLQWFQGEFARLFGPYRRGRCMEALKLDDECDSDEYHQYHLSLQRKKYKDRHG